MLYYFVVFMGFACEQVSASVCAFLLYFFFVCSDLFCCLFSNEREEGMNLGRWGDGEGLGGVAGREL